jgi:hypothetical protein
VSVREEGGTCWRTSSTRAMRVWTASDQYWADLGCAAEISHSIRGFEAELLETHITLFWVVDGSFI